MKVIAISLVTLLLTHAWTRNLVGHNRIECTCEWVYGNMIHNKRDSYGPSSWMVVRKANPFSCVSIVRTQ